MPEIGQSISHYRILENLGGSGMGVVCKAADKRPERKPAVSVLPFHLPARHSIHQGLKRQVTAISRCNERSRSGRLRSFGEKRRLFVSWFWQGRAPLTRPVHFRRTRPSWAAGHHVTCRLPHVHSKSAKVAPAYYVSLRRKHRCVRQFLPLCFLYLF